MITIFTAIGHLNFKKSTSPSSRYAIVAKSNQEHGLSKHELVLWSLLYGTFLTYEELQKNYYQMLTDYHISSELDMDYYLKRLTFRGLIASSCSYAKTSAIYDLIKKLIIRPHKKNNSSPFKPSSFSAYWKSLANRLMQRSSLSSDEHLFLKLIKKNPVQTMQLVPSVQSGTHILTVIINLYTKQLLYFDCV